MASPNKILYIKIYYHKKIIKRKIFLKFSLVCNGNLNARRGMDESLKRNQKGANESPRRLRK
jgi:hypothetical protein